MKKIFKTLSTLLAALFVGVVGFMGFKPTTYEAKADFTDDEIRAFVGVTVEDLIDTPGNPICFIMESGIVGVEISTNSTLNSLENSSAFVSELVERLRGYVNTESGNDLTACQVFEELGYKAIGHVSDYTYVNLLTGISFTIPSSQSSWVVSFCESAGVDNGNYALVGTIAWCPVQVFFNLLNKLQTSTYGLTVYTLHDGSPAFLTTGTMILQMRASYKGGALSDETSRWVS